MRGDELAARRRRALLISRPAGAASHRRKLKERTLSKSPYQKLLARYDEVSALFKGPRTGGASSNEGRQSK